MLGFQRCSWIEQRDDTISRRYQVRLGDVIDQAWSLRAVACDGVIGADIGVAHVHRTYGDHVRIIARRCDGSVSVFPTRVVAPVIAGRNHHNDPRFPSLLNGLGQRIQCVTFEDLAPQRKVKYPNVVLTF